MSKPLHVLVPSLSLPSRTPRTALSPARYPPVLSRLRRLALLTLALFSLARSQKLPRHYSAARSPFLDRFPSRQPLLALVFPFPPFFVRGTCSLLSPRFPGSTSLPALWLGEKLQPPSASLYQDLVPSTALDGRLPCFGPPPAPLPDDASKTPASEKVVQLSA